MKQLGGLMPDLSNTKVTLITDVILFENIDLFVI